MEVFERLMPTPNQVHRLREDVVVSADDLLRVPEGSITAEGLRDNVSVSLQYMAAWLCGNGCVPINNLMEDAATAEISRAQIWQWIRHPGGVLADGRKVTAELFRHELRAELERLRGVLGEATFTNGKYTEAAALLDEITTAPEFATFLTLAAYRERACLTIAESHPRPNDEDDSMPLKSAAELQTEWSTSPRWSGVERGYSAQDVVRLRGTVAIEHSLARLGAEKLWRNMATMPYVNALGALTGNQAMQQIRAGLKAIYLSGWQVAGDANLAGEMYPDQSLYPANSVPQVVRRINNTLLRADQLHHAEGDDSIDWLQPIVADAEAGFGGVLNAFELMKGMIEAGAAGVHFEDQLSSAKKCGHMGGKVLVPTQEAVSKLVAARLAADVCDVPTILVARTDAESANLLTADVDERDRPFIDESRGRTSEGFYYVRAGLDQAIARGLAYAPYADLLWCETGTPDLTEAKHFAEAIHAKFPGKMLAYNCSPSFNWKKKLDDATIAKFQRELGAMGYKFQFITLAGFHALNFSMFQLAKGYRESQMSAYVNLQQAEFAAEKDGYTATKHQREVGAGYFDDVTQTVSAGRSSVTAMKGSTEEEQFAVA